MACRVPKFRYRINVTWSGGNPPTAKETRTNGVKGGKKNFIKTVIYPSGRWRTVTSAYAATTDQVCPAHHWVLVTLFGNYSFPTTVVS